MYYGAAAAGVLKASQNIMGPANIWFLGLENVVPAETARRLHSGGIHSMLAYTRSILVKWGGLTILFAASMSLVPGFWLKLTYGPEMAQYGYVLRLYALEFTVPIFWSYLVMTALAFTFAVPMAKWLGLSGSLVGLIGAQVLFQSIVGISLLLRSRHMLKQQGLAPSSPTSVD
jgi:hypothetical protein